ncbi:glycosyltransferase family 2 protein [Lacticaseibacillus jixianensis]|uniref:Glycosyltransferase family 2 protein n=1 Tax=Lacticaseibacillus jixianensis TaxID=2486012 RepID=A0ABW4BAQ1_9LACO|nr:glycosyltransferase family A protein [Lacticaseibacillus jixianensis]
MMSEDLTLVIPTYQLGSYFQPMLDDLIAQTADFTLWLVDDGSTDGTAERGAAFVRGVPNFHHEALGTHRGVSVARNFGLDRTTSGAVAFIDGDDRVAPTFAAALRGGFQADVAAVAVGYRWFRALPRRQAQELVLDQHAMFEQASQHGTEVGGYVWNKAFRTAAIRKANLRFDESLRLAEDYLFTASFVAATPGPYVYLPAVLYTKRNRPNSTIHTAGWEARRQEAGVFDRIYAMGRKIH